MTGPGSHQIIQLEQLQALYYSRDPAQVAQAEELLRSLGAHPVALLFWQHHTSRELAGGFAEQRAAIARLADRPELRRADLRSQVRGVIVGYMARGDDDTARERAATLLRAALADPALALRFWEGCATDGVLHSVPEPLHWRDREALFFDIIRALPDAERGAIHTIQGPGFRWRFPPDERLLDAFPGVVALDISEVSPSREPQAYRCLSAIRSLRLTLRGDLPSEGMAHLAGLETLDVSQSRGLRALPAGLGRCPRLHEIEARDCESLAAVGEGLGQAPSLAVLRLDGCGALAALPEALGRLPRLRVLGLSGCGRLQSVPAELSDRVETDVTGCTSLTGAPPWLLTQLCTSDHAAVLAATPETVSLPAAARKKVATRIRALLRSALWLEVCVALDGLNRFADPALDRLMEKALLGEVRKRLRGRGEARFEQGLAMLRRLTSSATLLALWQDSDPSSPETLGAELRGLRGVRTVQAAWALIGMLPAAQAGAITALSPQIFPEQPGAADWEVLGRLSGLRALRHKSFPEQPAVARGLRSLRSLVLCGDLGEGLPDALALLPSLERLEIERGYLLCSVPPVLGRLPVLRELVLSECASLSEGGDIIATMTGLEVLRLKRTPLSIPSVERLTRLRELRLDPRAQQVLPDLRGLGALRHLDLTQHSALQALPEALPELEALVLRSCRALTTLPSSLSRRPLRLLDIRGTGIRSVPAGLCFAPGAVVRLEAAQLLSLLPELDRQVVQLGELEVDGHIVGLRGSPGEVMAGLLRRMPDVDVLDVSAAQNLSRGVETLDLSTLRYKVSVKSLSVTGWKDLRRICVSGSLPPKLHTVEVREGSFAADNCSFLSRAGVSVVLR